MKKKRLPHLVPTITLFLLPQSSTSHIAINLRNGKSQYYEGLKQNSTTDENHHLQQQQENNPLDSIASLDLSGRFDIHITSPIDDEEDPSRRRFGEASTTPLFRIGKRRRGFPSLHLDVEYDFGRKWYGIHRILSLFSWRIRSRDALTTTTTATTATNDNNDWRQNVAREMDGSTIQLRAEPKSASFHFQTPPNDFEDDTTSSSSVTAQILSSSEQIPHPHATLSIRAKLHRRIDFISKSLHFVHPQQQQQQQRPWSPRSSSSSSFAIPVNNNPDGWIPQLKLNPTGKLTSTSEMGWRMGRIPIAVRFVLTKQFYDWLPSSMEEGTFVKLEVKGVDSVKREGSLSVVVEGELERWGDTAHCTIVREWMVASSSGGGREEVDGEA